METIGWIGSILLAFCGLPEAIVSIKQGRCNVSWGFLLMWYLGEIFTLAYIVSDVFSYPLILNYGLNLTFISTMIYYKLRPRE